jgi:allophanate hydrolase subunit 2
LPDDNLAAKVALARERGLGRRDFYHYGICRLQALDWIQQALATT